MDMMAQASWLKKALGSMRRALPVALGVCLLVGCAIPPKPSKGSPDLLKFVKDGQTTREQAIHSLGQPSGRFGMGKVLTWRLGYSPINQGYYPVKRETQKHQYSGWTTWTQATFSLVLVFDDSGVLCRHALVKVNK